MLLEHLLKGMASYFPGLLKMFLKGTGGTNLSRYCYSVWLRHMVMADKNGLSTCPHVLAELGPGDSLGTGLAAMLCGTDKYYGFDVIRYANNQQNIQIFEELITMFKNRENIPDEKEFPMLRPYLDKYDFPQHILTEQRLAQSLQPDRIESIRQALKHPDEHENSNIAISYYVPWDDNSIIKEQSVDMVITQGVMQLIENLPAAYEALSKWLKPGGYMSHETDFTAFRAAEKWNGYWAYSPLLWKLIKGKRQNLVSRAPHSEHIHLMKKNQFKIICDNTIKDDTGISRCEIAPQFQYLSDEDLCTSGAFIQAIKET